MPFNCFTPNSNGQPIKIIEISDEHRLVLNENGLKSVLFHPKCKGKQVCLISVAGAFRKGKSFLLNFFIRFFKNGGRDNWLGNENDLLNGFHWRGGCDRDTTGVFLWSEPFLLRTLQNEEVVVLLMDTQGAFDTTSTIKDCATLFALSLMVSSVQIYNLTQNIQEDDLQHLHLFADYGRLALNETNHSPFQMLLFLIRDWPYSYEFPYGFIGGQNFLLKRLNSNLKTQELTETRSFIKKCFKMIRCFLLPHPGLTASSNANFGGKLSDVDSQFKQQTVNLIEGLFQEKMFQIKEINGQRITCSELFEYFKIYSQVFQSNELPSPKTLLRATAEANNLAAKASAKEFYQKIMDQYCNSDTPIKPELLRSMHIDAKTKAIKNFEFSKKLGGSEISVDYLKQLNNELDSMFTNYSNHINHSPNSSKTSIILLILMAINYTISNFLNALWLGCFSFIFMFIFYISFFALVFWYYMKCNGQYKDLLSYIDLLSNFLWDKIIQPISKKIFSNIFHIAFSNFTIFTKSNYVNNNALNTILTESINTIKYVNSRGDTKISTSRN